MTTFRVDDIKKLQMFLYENQKVQESDTNYMINYG